MIVLTAYGIHDTAAREQRVEAAEDRADQVAYDAARERCGDAPTWMPETMRTLGGARYHFCRLAPGHGSKHVNNEGRSWGDA